MDEGRTAIPFEFLGAGVSLVGFVCLLVGLFRALKTIDWLLLVGLGLARNSWPEPDPRKRSLDVLARQVAKNLADLLRT